MVVCAAGLAVAQRGARLPARIEGLRVAPVGGVKRPIGSGLDSRRADDLAVWRRLWPEPDRLVVEYVGVTWVEVDDRTGHVVFDTRLDDEMEQHLLFDHVLPLVLARRGRLVLHGGVVARDGAGAVLVGPTGAGKSTLAAHLWSRGWAVGGDDGAVVGLGANLAVEPTYATVRITSDAAALLGLPTADASPVVGKRRLLDEQRPFRQDAVALRAVAFVEPVPVTGRPSFRPFAPGVALARLLGSAFHPHELASQQMATTMQQLAVLVEGAVVGALAVPRGVAGLRAAEEELAAALAATGPAPALS